MSATLLFSMPATGLLRAAKAQRLQVTSVITRKPELDYGATRQHTNDGADSHLVTHIDSQLLLFCDDSAVDPSAMMAAFFGQVQGFMCS